MVVAESIAEIPNLGGAVRRQAVAEKRAVAGERIFYSPEPLAARGKLAFLYPGAGTVYAGMGAGAGGGVSGNPAAAGWGE